MKLNDLPEIDRTIYWICYDIPKTSYEVIAELSMDGMGVSYSHVNQRINIMIALKLMKKVVTMGKKVLYKSEPIPKELDEEETKEVKKVAEKEVDDLIGKENTIELKGGKKNNDRNKNI